MFTTGCRIDSDRPDDIMTINLQSRIANKVYRQLATGPAKTFEELFQLTKTIDRHRFLPATVPFTVRVVSTDSLLHAERSVQSIVHKAVITGLTGDPDAHRPTDEMAQSQEIFVIIEHDVARLFINTS